MRDGAGRERNANLDVLRVVACFLVVLSHVSSEGIDSMAVSTLDWKLAHMYNSLGHTGTILFFFISGALLLAPDYPFEPQKFYANNFLKLFAAYYSWIVIYHIYGLVERGQYTAAIFKDMMINIIRGIASYHFWYVPMLLGIYLLLPMLRAICHSGQKLVNYFVALFLTVQIGFFTVRIFDFPHKYLAESLMDRIPFTLVNHHVGYFVMGYWLKTILEARKADRMRRSRLGTALIIAGVGGGLIGDYTASLRAGRNIIQCNELFSASMCMSAVGIFIVVHTLKLHFSERAGRLLTEAAKLSFGVYMVHPLVWAWVFNIGPLQRLPMVLRVPLRTVLVFVISYLISWLLGLLPVVRQWVVYAGGRPGGGKKSEGRADVEYRKAG